METLTEGLLEFTAGSAQGPKGPGKREVGFYNLPMAFSRDLSVAVLDAYRGYLRSEEPSVIDGFCGTGVRGLRMALESPPIALHLNDADERTAAIARRNMENAGVEAEVTALPFYKALSHGPYDVVDIDPYGTPAPHVLPAVPALKRRALLCVAATDTAALCGSNPRTLKRRYMVDRAPSAPDHEFALRALVGYITRTCASAERGVRPLLCYHRDHHYRVFLEVRAGAMRADGSLGNLGMVFPDKTRLQDAPRSGPVWTGPLGDPEFIRSLRFSPDMAFRADLEKMRGLWAEESVIGTFHHDSSRLASSLGRDMAPLSRIIEALRERGYRAARSSFDPQGFVTDASDTEVLHVYAGLEKDVGND